MNNKGQVLVIFVLVIPIIILILALVVDVGFLYSEKRNVDNVVKDTINYGLNNISEDKDTLKDKMTKLLNSNISDIKNYDITVNYDSIQINISVIKKSIFSNVYAKAEYEITSSYSGSINNNIKTIRKGS